MSKLIKWSGSKDSQSNNIIKFIPKDINYYYEPFVGGGSVFLKLLESNYHNIKNFVISDINKDLINIYCLIKNDPIKLINTYKNHYKEFNSYDIEYRKKYFKKVKKNYNQYHNADDFYWIMRTTTNGMPRYNKKHEFNNSCHFTRSGMNPLTVEKLINKYHILFNKKNITFLSINYKKLIIFDKSLLYLDPPYQNTKSMYFSNFNNSEFIDWVNNLNYKWIISLDGKINDKKVNHKSPEYLSHKYLISGNSSFRRVMGKSNKSIISESLYLNYNI
jgi:DNA adenine methylase